MWLASTAEEAIERAEIEALEYAGATGESPDTDDYLNAFFDTGAERQSPVEGQTGPGGGGRSRGGEL
jgi:hypothetical protein